MTYAECEEYYDFYTENENDKTRNLLKAFAIYNLESSTLASRGTRSQMATYLRQINKDEEPKENDIDRQFNEVSFE